MTRIYLTPKQREANNLLENNTILIYGGGIRGGKSFFLLLTFLTYCFKYPGSRWLVLRESMPTLKRNLFPTFNKLLDMGFRQYVREWNQSTQEVTFTNGSQILFMAESYDDDKELNRFRGLEINGAGIDEINECNEKTFYKIIERSGSWTQAGKVPIKILATCNPSHGWVKDLIYDPHKNGTLKKGWAFIQALITDNPYIDKDYLQSLINNMPDYEYEVFVKGNWDLKLEGVLFDRNEFTYFKKSDFKTDGLEAVLGYIDVADQGTDRLAFPIGHIFKGKVFITDVLFTNATSDISPALCAEKIKQHNISYTRVESNNQGNIYAKLLRQMVAFEKIQLITHSSNKHTRIILEYGFIKQHFAFLAPTEYAPCSDYDLFMKEIFMYMKDGTSEHDDAPDALAGLAKFITITVPHLFEPEKPIK